MIYQFLRSCRLNPLRLFGGLILSALLVFTPCSHSFAATPNKNAGTTSFAFLRQEVGARASALAGASSAVVIDASSIWSNPGALVRLERREFLASYQNQFAEFNAGYIAAAFPRGKQAFAFALQYYSYGTFVQTNMLGEVTGEFSGGDLVAIGSYSRAFGPRFSAGGSVKFVKESIQDFSASGLAVDLGLRYQTDRGREAFALVVQNLGTQLDALGSEKGDMPMQLRLGAMINPRKIDVRLSGDLVMPSDNSLWGAIGLEYVALSPLSLRLGWSSFGSNAKVEGASADLAGFAFGIGVEVNKQMSFGYSLGTHGDLGENHRITISGGF